jgi:hypothetical protein
VSVSSSMVSARLQLMLVRRVGFASRVHSNIQQQRGCNCFESDITMLEYVTGAVTCGMHLPELLSECGAACIGCGVRGKLMMHSLSLMLTDNCAHS